MKKKILFLILTLCFAGVQVLATVGEKITAEIVNPRIADEVMFYDERTLEYPILSYNDYTYLAVRDAAEIFGYDVKWYPSGNLISLTEKRKKIISNIETVENIAKLILTEYFPGEVRMDDFCDVRESHLGRVKFYTVFVFTDEDAVEKYGDDIDSNLAEFRVSMHFTGEIISILRSTEQGFEEVLAETR